MPVNMDPSKKRRRNQPKAPPVSTQAPDTHAAAPPPSFGEETDADREKALADAELTNLWDATEVIDMDKF